MPERSPAATKLCNAARRAISHPAWLRETARTKLRARTDRRLGFSLADHAEHLTSVSSALGDAFGVSPADCRRLATRVRIPCVGDGPAWGGGLDILQLVGSVVLLRRPAVVLETGVARGFTTAVILAAMDENGAGALHSIDLPPLQVHADEFVGQVVPDALRGRWTLHVGPSRKLLPDLARALEPLDVFIHDSDHSRAAQLEEYRRVWPHLAAGGCLISDDVSNPAFVEFAAEVGARPYLIAPPRHNAAVGLVVKRGAAGG